MPILPRRSQNRMAEMTDQPHGTNRNQPRRFAPNGTFSVVIKMGFNDGNLSAAAKAEGVKLPWPGVESQIMSGSLLNRMVASGAMVIAANVHVPPPKKSKPAPEATNVKGKKETEEASDSEGEGDDEKDSFVPPEIPNPDKEADSPEEVK